MVNNLEVIWILNKDGLCFLQRVFNKSMIYMDENKFSGLITSIIMFSKDIFEESFDKLIMGEKEIFIKSYSNITVALAAKRGAKGKAEKEIFNLIEEIGLAFQIEYAEFLNSNLIIDSSIFDKFGVIIDQICGLETFVYLEEHDALIDLLKDIEMKGLDESLAVQEILKFLDDLNDYKLEIMINTAGEIISPIISNSDILDTDQKRRYSKLLN